MLKLSIIVPVYNRPDELKELLESLVAQTYKDFEIVIVEDGSAEKSDKVVEGFSNKLTIRYFYKQNEKPAIARNFGMKKAAGNYYLFFDSDCIVPPHYMERLTNEMAGDYVDAFGGPDKANDSFTKVQKAINYAMTSFLTTGGIRGGEKIDKFYPRSFNMGLSQRVFEETGGFPVTKMHPGEDMVLSIEIIKRGYRTRLIKDAYVYHKRRTSLKMFFKQVFKFGKVRYIMSVIYPETFKLFYLFPGLFALGTAGLLLLSFFNLLFLMPIGLFAVAVFFDSLLKNKNLYVALLSVPASFFQLTGYGTGFISAWLKKSIFGKDEYGIFKNGFYTAD
jgi:glycosyltransferase involved in cell wall biosynthesis